MIRSVLKPAIAAVALLAASALTALAQDPDDDTVVATVNGTEITFGDLLLAEEELGAALDGLPDEVRFQYILGTMIDRRVLSLAAREQNLEDDPAVQRRVEHYREKALRDVYWSRQLEDTVTPEAARTFYDGQIASAEEQDEIRARHILLPSEEEALEAIAMIEGGKDFAEAAEELSKGPSASDGGDLGWFGPDDMVPEFGEAAFALAPGTVSQPVKTKFGWHVIKVEERRAREPAPFEEIEPQIMQALAEQEGRTLMSDLRDKASIVIVGAETPDPAQPSD